MPLTLPAVSWKQFILTPPSPNPSLAVLRKLFLDPHCLPSHNFTVHSLSVHCMSLTPIPHHHHHLPDLAVTQHCSCRVGLEAMDGNSGLGSKGCEISVPESLLCLHPSNYHHPPCQTQFLSNSLISSPPLFPPLSVFLVPTNHYP